MRNYRLGTRGLFLARQTLGDVGSFPRPSGTECVTRGPQEQHRAATNFTPAAAAESDFLLSVLSDRFETSPRGIYCSYT